MRILHVHDQAFFRGGVEQILFDTANGLSQHGCPQALLFSGGVADERFSTPFECVSDDMSIIQSFKPDVVLLHKVADTDHIAELTRSLPNCTHGARPRHGLSTQAQILSTQPIGL